jgi:hypothetical protein
MRRLGNEKSTGFNGRPRWQAETREWMALAAAQHTITSLAPNGKAINRKWEFDLVSGAHHQPSC